MNNCSIKPLYTRNNDFGELESRITSIYESVKGYNDRAIRLRLALVNELKNELFNFNLIYNKKIDKEKYIKILDNFIEDVISIADKFKINTIKLRSELQNTLSAELGLGTVDSKFQSTEEKADIPNSEKHDKLQSFKEFINSVYGVNVGANWIRHRRFKLELFNHTICDFIGDEATGTIVLNNEQLNQQIILYKNKLYKLISDYLSAINPGHEYQSLLYSSDGFVLAGYNNVLDEFKSLLLNNNNIQDFILQEYFKVLQGLESKFLDALNAYTNLTYFDDLLTDVVGRYVSIRSNAYRNKEVGFYFKKYIFSSDSEHKRKSWNEDGDARTAALNTSRWSKMVLDYIPLEIKFSRIAHPSVGIVNLQNAYSTLFAKINLIVGNSSSATLKTLKSYIDNFPNNHIKYSALITDLCANNDIIIRELKRKGFSDTLLAVFKSMDKYVFGFSAGDMRGKKFKEFQHKTLRALLMKERRMRVDLGKYTIIEDICAVIRDSVDSTYTQTEVDYTGLVSYRLREKSKQIDSAVGKFTVQLNTQILNIPENVFNEWNKTCLISYDSLRDVKFTIEGLPLLRISSNEDVGIMTVKNTVNYEDSKVLDKILKTLDNLDSNRVKNIITGDGLTNDEQQLRAVLKFIDDRLGTKYLTDDGMVILQIQSSNMNNIIKNELVPFAVRALIVAKIYNDYKNSEYKTLKHFLERTSYRTILNNYEKEDKYFSRFEGIYNINVFPKSTLFVQLYIKAREILYGLDITSVSKNVEGNNDANTSTAYLGATINQINAHFNNLRNSGNSFATNHLLFTTNSNAIQQHVISMDLRSGSIKKVIKKAKVKELIYNSIFHSFYAALLEFDGIVIQPTTYSDKTKNVLYIISNSHLFDIRGKKVALKNMTLNDIENLYFDTIGKFTITAYNNVKNRLCTILGIDASSDVITINKAFKEFSLEAIRLGFTPEEYLINRATSLGLNIERETDYRITNNGIEFNEVLDYLANYLYANENNLRKKLKLELFNFIDDLLLSGINFYIGYKGTDFKKIVSYINSNDVSNRNAVANAIHDRYSTSKQIEDYLLKWVKNGKLILRIGDDVNPLLKEYFYKYSLLSNNLRFALTGSEIVHPDKSEYYEELLLLLPLSVLTLFKNGEINLSTLLRTPEFSELAINTLNIIENIEQGTLLKRNVIIPATMHYIQPGDIRGVGYKTKVAVMEDIKAGVWNFLGSNKPIDAHDGSAFTCAILSILENNSLTSLEVGSDKKPIWHDYSPETGTAKLVKFASFEITNLRIRDSLNSDVSLLNMVKKMLNFLWSGEWVSSGLLQNRKLKAGTSRPVTWEEITNGESVYYETDEGGYRLIIDFGKDDNGYYTIEKDVDIVGFDEDGEEKKVYHFYDNYGNHYTEFLEGLHTINSLYELWNSVGGAYSMEQNPEGVLIPSEKSNYLVVLFMNNVIFPINNDIDIYDLTLNSYYLPLKELFIGYLINMSAIKNGATNINSSKKWYNDEKLSYFEMNTKNLGIQMDADHEMEESQLTEFSLVLTALEAGGRLHERAKLVYQDLGKVAAATASLEIDAISKIIDAEINGIDVATVKSDLYELVGRTLLNLVKTGKSDLSEAILTKIEKRFGVNRDHIKDAIKIPFSDPSIYSSILSTVVSIINEKSIKRKYPGSGCVMVPSYGIMLYFKIPQEDGSYRKLKFDDVLRNARKAGFTSNLVGNAKRQDIVRQYLKNIPRKLVQLTSFVPSDIVDIVADDGTEITLKLDTLEKYYAFLDKNWNFFNKQLTSELLLSLINSKVFKFYENITSPRDLAPSRISWQYKENGVLKDTNLFLLPGVREGKGVQKYLDEIDKGFFTIDGVTHQVLNLVNEPAEMMISSGYASLFGIEGRSIAEIEEEGADAFLVTPPSPVDTKHWDIAFGKANGSLTYISFDRTKSDKDNLSKYIPWEKKYLKTIESSNGALNVWYCNDDNVPLFKVGRQVIAKDVDYVPAKYDQSGKLIEKAKFINTKTNETIVDDENYSIDKNGQILEYIQYLSKYNRTEPTINDGKILSYETYDVFLIDINKIHRAFNKRGDDSDKSNLTNFTRSILDDIFASDLFSSLLVNKNLSKSTCSIIRTSVKGMENLPEYLRTDLLSPIISEIDTLLLDLNKTYVDLSEFDMDTLQETVYNKLKNERFSTWKLSLIYTAARIPALSLQSFMKMQAVAYTGSTKNVVHVSHFQAFLQGSDYDIDKAYMMGFEIGNDGRLVKYSDIMDLSSPEMLAASLYLPTSSEIKNITFVKTNENALDITEYLEHIGNMSTPLDMHVLSKLIIAIHDYYEKHPMSDNYGRKQVNVYYDSNIVKSFHANKIIEDYVLKHEKTEISPLQREKAYKVAISANIGNIVQNIRNADLSYRPVMMDDLHEVGDKSEKGMKIRRMSMMNPATIFNMQVLNMVGKLVIGIAAVGEKVFFNLSYYWNEGIKSENQEYLNNLKFEKTFNRILGRYSGNIESVTRRAISNVNFENNLNIIELFTSTQQYNNAVALATQQFVEFPNLTDEEKELVVRDILYKLSLNLKEVDLLISLVLSAATDNAKELILAKINCDENLAKCYIHLLIMGFDIKDIVSFMTSPVVETIAKFADPNMFDSYIQETKLSDAVKLIRGYVNISDFLSGIKTVRDEDGTESDIDVALSIGSTIKVKLKQFIDTKNIKGPNQVVQAYIRARLDGIEIPKLNDILSKRNVEEQLFADYVENVINILKATKSKYNTELEFYDDIQEFENILELADETSSLGNVLLGMNLGLATDKESLQNKLKKILDLITVRENKFGLVKYAKGSKEELEKVLTILNSGQVPSKIPSILNDLKKNNPTLDDVYIINTLLESWDIIGNFDIEKWLYDIEGYRKRVSNYYNIIKSYTNIFDMSDKIPLYKEIVELLKTVYVIDKYTSQKSELVNHITDDLVKRYNYVDSKFTGIISKYVNDLLLINYFEDRNYIFPTKEGYFEFDKFGETLPVTHSGFIELNTTEGRASFKRIMEEQIVPTLKSLNFDSFNVSDILYLRNNKFIDGLVTSYDTNGFSYLSLDIDMRNTEATPTSMIKYSSYLSDFEKLSNIYIGNYSLLDWFILYNLITNLNMYGSDRLTKIFENVAKYKDVSILNDYFSYLGDLDYNHDPAILDKLGYDIQDVLLRSATPIYHVPRYGTDKELCYKHIKSNGQVLYYVKLPTGSYSKTSYYPLRNSEVVTDTDITLQTKVNYLKHWTMPMKVRTAKAALYTGIISKNSDTVFRTLLIYMLRGDILIRFENC